MCYKYTFVQKTNENTHKYVSDVNCGKAEKAPFKLLDPDCESDLRDEEELDSSPEEELLENRRTETLNTSIKQDQEYRKHRLKYTLGNSGADDGTGNRKQELNTN